MKTFFLLPHRFKMIGWLLFVPALVACLFVGITGQECGALDAHVFALVGSDMQQATTWFTTVSTNLTYTLLGCIFIIGGLLVAFSQEPEEDEYIGLLRLSAFQWSVFANYALLLILFLCVYGLDFLFVLSYHLFTVIVLFVARFHYLLYQYRRIQNDEK